MHACMEAYKTDAARQVFDKNFVFESFPRPDRINHKFLKFTQDSFKGRRMTKT